MEEIDNEGPKYTGGEVLRFVVAYTGAQSLEWDHRLSFVKHLRRWGVPNAANLRRGPAAQYGHADLFQLAVAMELTELGLTVAAAARVVKRTWSLGLSEVPERVRTSLAAGEVKALLLVVWRTTFDGFDLSPTRAVWEFLEPLPPFGGDGLEARIVSAQEFAGSDFFQARMTAPSPYGRQRCLVINLSQVVQGVDALAADVDALNALNPASATDQEA